MLLAPPAAWAAAEAAAVAGDTLDEQIDHWLRRGYDAPDQAVAALTAPRVDQPPEAHRALLTAPRGIVQAQSGPRRRGAPALADARR